MVYPIYLVVCFTLFRYCYFSHMCIPFSNYLACFIYAEFVYQQVRGKICLYSILSKPNLRNFTGYRCCCCYGLPKLFGINVYIGVEYFQIVTWLLKTVFFQLIFCISTTPFTYIAAALKGIIWKLFFVCVLTFKFSVSLNLGLIK